MKFLTVILLMISNVFASETIWECLTEPSRFEGYSFLMKPHSSKVEVYKMSGSCGTGRQSRHFCFREDPTFLTNAEIVHY